MVDIVGYVYVIQMFTLVGYIWGRDVEVEESKPKNQDEYYGVCIHVYHKQRRGHCMRRFKGWKSDQYFGF